MIAALPLPALAALFAAAAGVIWIAGLRLTAATDELCERYGIEQALGGVVLLAFATNLPEVAITASAALGGHVELAVGNILGGIAVQTAVIALLDGFGTRGRPPLTHLAQGLPLVVAGLLVVAVLVLSIMGTQLPATLSLGRVGPIELLIVVTWVAGLLLVDRAAKLPWTSTIADTPSTPPGDENLKPAGRALLIFVLACLATLAAGVLIEATSSAIADRLGISGILFGATVLAAATALPEISTGLAATKLEDWELAVSDVLGGNAFLPVLFLPASLLAGRPVLSGAEPANVYLAGLGIMLTAIYLFGLLFRSERTFLGLGPDSLAVLIVFTAGIAGVVALG